MIAVLSWSLTPQKRQGNFIFVVSYKCPTKSYGHVRMVISDFVRLLPDIKMDGTSSPAIKQHPSKQTRIICRGVFRQHISWAGLGLLSS